MSARPDRGEVHVVLGVRRHLAHRARDRVERPDVVAPVRVAVGEEVQRRAVPHRLAVARVVVPDPPGSVRGQVEQPDARYVAAAIAFPGAQVLAVRHERQRLAVRRDLAELAVRHRQPLGQAALGGELVELGEAQAPARHRRRVQDRLAVRVPVQHPVGHRVMGEAPRHPAVGGHDVDVLVAVVVAGEGDQRAVRREARERLLALRGREPRGDPAPLRGDPDVAGVDERDLRRGHGGLAHQPGVDGREGRHGDSGEDGDQQRIAKISHQVASRRWVVRPAGCEPRAAFAAAGAVRCSI